MARIEKASNEIIRTNPVGFIFETAEFDWQNTVSPFGAERARELTIPLVHLLETLNVDSVETGL